MSPKPYPNGPPPPPPQPCIFPDKVIDGVSYYSQETVAKMFTETWHKINNDSHSPILHAMDHPDETEAL